MHPDLSRSQWNSGYQQTLIFSFLKIRKKTSAAIAGLLIGGACLWGIALWQDISPRQLFSIFLGSFAFILAIMVLALGFIVLAKLLGRLINSAKKDG